MLKLVFLSILALFHRSQGIKERLEDVLDNSRFYQFLKRNRISLSSQSDLAFRRVIFLRREAKVRLNNLFDSFKMELNRFSILTDDERNRFLGTLTSRDRPTVGEEEDERLLNRVSFSLSNWFNEKYQKILDFFDKIRYRFSNLWDDRFPDDVEITPNSVFGQMIALGETDVDWQRDGKVTSVKNQGSCGSCWAFAAAAAVESLYLIQNPGSSHLDLAEQEMVDDCDPRMDCKGGWNDYALEYIRDNGIHHESDYPYRFRSGNCKRNNSDSKTTINGIGYIEEGDMVDFLTVLSIQPVVVAFHVSEDFFEYANRLIDPKRPGICPSYEDINHAVIAVGFFIDEDDPDNSYIKFKNQWGTDWGEDGFFRFKLYNEDGLGPCKLLKWKTMTVYPKL